MKKLLFVMMLGSLATVTADQYSQYQSSSGYYNPNARTQPSSTQSYYQPSNQQQNPQSSTYYSDTQQYQPYTQPTSTYTIPQPYQNQPNNNRNYYQQSTPSNSSNYYQQSTPSNPSNYYQPGSSSNINNSPTRPGQLASNLHFNTQEQNPQGAQGTQGTQGAQGTQGQPSPMSWEALQNQISKKVHEILYGYLTDGNQNMSFEFNEGTVTLTGYVRSQEEKDRIEQDVKRIPGIKQVNNKLVVADSKKFAYYQPQNSNPNTAVKNNKLGKDYAALEADKKINTKIREKLDNGNFTDVSIITANGVVTLNGVVDDSTRFFPLVTEIERIEGVKKVNNKVTSKE